MTEILPSAEQPLSDERYEVLITAAANERRLRDVALRGHISLDTLKHWLKQSAQQDASPWLRRFAREFAAAERTFFDQCVEDAMNDMEVEIKDVPAELAVDVFPDRDRTPVANLARKLAKLGTKDGKSYLMKVKRRSQARAKWRFIEQRWPVREGEDDLMDLFQSPSNTGNVWRLLNNPTPRFAELLRRLFTEAPAPIVALLTSCGWRRE